MIPRKMLHRQTAAVPLSEWCSAGLQLKEKQRKDLDDGALHKSMLYGVDGSHGDSDSQTETEYQKEL